MLQIHFLTLNNTEIIFEKPLIWTIEYIPFIDANLGFSAEKKNFNEKRPK